MSLRLITAAVLAAALLPACKSPMPSGKMEDVVEARATVTAVDAATRQVSLKEADGTELDVIVTDAVKNFDQIKPGDEVVVSYTEAVAWQVKPAGQGAPGVSSNTSTSVAEPGQKPYADVKDSITVTATITAIDLAKGTATITGPNGRAETVKARDPANLKKVKVGDLVDITYSEAVALAVRPATEKKQ